MAYKRTTSLMSSYPTRYNAPAAMAGVVTIESGGDPAIARLQAAINRIVLGARADDRLGLFESQSTPTLNKQAIARAMTLVPLAVNGKADDGRTRVAAQSAGLIAGASTVEVSTPSFIEKLESFSDAQGYPAGDTIAERIFGISVPGIPKLGLTGKTVAIAGGAILLVGVTLYLRRRRAP